ncbi:pinopsin [Halyomorpha halys]|uniref:pinopsin n=1 Tax=Halyomorpha halys TaxID=286706 RepID=UPI0006D4E69C|nr:pinopsin-like [Halyomorpha halys]
MELLMPAGGYVAASIILFFIGFIGFFANLTVIVVMCRDQQLWTPLNYILLNLIMSDFSVSLLGNPFTFVSAVAKTWIFGKTMCIIYGFFMAILGITSIGTLSVLSLERYLIISRPVSHGQLTRKTAILLVMAVWLYSFTLTFPPLIGWGEYGPEAANLSCSVNWETRSHSSTSYIMYLFIFGFFLPIIIICYSYMNIIFTIKKSRSTAGRVAKAESRVTWMVAIMILAFFISWTPYAISALLIAFLDARISPGLATVPAVFAKTSICYNPIIYVGLNSQFRQSWKRLLGFREDCSEVTTGLTGGISPRRPQFTEYKGKIKAETAI